MSADVSLEQELRREAETNEYLRVVSQRIGDEIAKRIDLEAFANGDDAYMQTLAATFVAIVINELGDDAITAGEQLARAAGFDQPSKEEIDQALLAAVTTTLNTLRADLQEQQDQVAKALDRAGSGLSGSLQTGLTLALAAVLAEAGRNLTGDITTELNAEVAVGPGRVLAFPGGASAPEPRRLRWVTMRDKRVCHEPSGPYESTSGDPIPPNAASACGGRHGLVLTAEDWAAEGLPRDPRLLCSRFRRPRCRCRLVAVSVAAPVEPVDVQEEIKRGRAAGEEEPLELQDDHLGGAFRIVAKTLRPLIDPNEYPIKIRIRRRAARAA